MFNELLAFVALAASASDLDEKAPAPVVEMAKSPEGEARADNEWWIYH